MRPAASPRLLLASGTLVLLLALGVADPAGANIYWSSGCPGSGGPIGRADQGGRNVKRQLIPNASCDSLAVQGQYLYWTGTVDGSIGRATINGAGVDRSFLTLPEIDPDTGAQHVAADSTYLYWTEQHNGHETIGRANLDGTGIDEEFVKGIAIPFALAVDDAHIYWADQSGIGRANLDGTKPNNRFISAKYVYGVAASSTHIYWTNYGGRMGRLGTIGRANLDGSKPNARFITGAHSPHALAVDNRYVYWDNETGNLGRARLDGKNVSQAFIRRAGGFGIAVDRLGPAS